MGGFFNIENGLFSVLGKICDVIFLSFIWIIFCIPIITIGPANTALYYATVKVIRRERGYLFREFFKSFRLNFKRAMISGIILTALIAILFFDIIWARGFAATESKLAPIVMGVFIAISILLISVSIYIFPILSRFDMTLKQLFKAGVFMSIRHLPSTIVMVVILVAALLGASVILPLVFVLPSLTVLLISLLMERIFKKYMPQSEEAEEDKTKDEWYME